MPLTLAGQYISKLESGLPHHRRAGTGRREARARAAGPVVRPTASPGQPPTDPRTSCTQGREATIPTPRAVYQESWVIQSGEQKLRKFHLDIEQNEKMSLS